MKIFRYIVILLIAGGAAFGTGYFMNAAKVSGLNSEINALKLEAQKKELQAGVLRIKWHAEAALVALLEKNFGIAGEEIALVKELLSKETVVFPGRAGIINENIKRVTEEIQADIEGLDVRKAKQKIRILADEADRMLLLPAGQPEEKNPGR
ncbi:hypothetical protein COY52_08500 [Candidatus Desantisbacteria bacterium CG_4_10_14_0_8_um_filter_48_22]|uniref:Uncharacterized protein n=1 Tax=Candidatus Desantisbacteria bacterium CG_4_10_14_0_8_um_filter_48_22 TaxID=1974543 RepID=A0A2M7S8S5_9BACT|nr:MAG: hypothetical protein AUJ67_10150 [Candidatus Desantisbacteria bacterium CG1_02_49_89]PIV54477.1 MAG: hypothetical protein COS16_10165 [Candidatus Desantisbacteria bacterium CG02_land_8_20_14_3_00_49_13]PIZ15926.1 MAG: hypothetical protein COY52_08500 [Candidatus Desantisbacteria bacterium CG_4_10_14_0_8_um_filter_48_22]PJB27525.1 MAG: hypothetical protein CO111_04885 [Candidatus Desantisbacteria bacterium CG_4_9_14_3_um_filter_50_7]